jgi:hypothetical protein
MIIDDTHRFVFMHIPKCAGSSVRAQLSRWDFRDDAFHQPGHHADLGAVHFAHLPLAFLRTYYPIEFAKVATYRSFALTRDPRARFASATIQHLREFRGVRDLNLDSRRIVSEAHRVIDWLEGKGLFCDLEYIHFSRQIDYVELEGRRIVAEVFPIEDMSAFAMELEATCGIVFEPERRENANLAADNPLLATLRLAKPLYRRLTSWKDRERLLLLMRRLKIHDPASLYARLLANERVARFVEDYYADDFALHQASTDRLAMSPAARHEGVDQ